MSRLRTRIESRTLAFFVVCALVPVAVFALAGYIMVDRQLTELTSTQMNAAAKAYGIALYDRLINVDRQLSVLAQRRLQDDVTAEAIADFSDERASIRVVAERAVDDASETGVRKHLLVSDGMRPDIHLEVIASDDASSVHLSALLSPDYLWNADSVLIGDAVICASDSRGTTLHCSSDDRQPTDASTAIGEWSLFLKGVYDSPPWSIRISAPAGDAVASFRWLLPASGALAVVIALLAGSIFIRRSHAPLRLLAESAGRIGRKRFDRPVRVSTGDEYGRLARAFNRMARRLDDQFDLLGLLARLDLAILARSGIGAAVQGFLPRLPGLLKCRAVAIVLLDDGEVCFVARGIPGVERTALAPHALAPHALAPHALARVDEQLAGTYRLSGSDRDSPAFDGFARHGSDSVLVQPVLVAGKARALLLVSDEGAQRRFLTRRLRDIAQRLAVAFGNEDHERQLRQQAYQDSLTGLANRARLHEWLENNVLSAGDVAVASAVIFFDLDRFKSVNDSLGHSLGDSLLKEVARRLQRQLPATALLARFGGDEFVIVLPQTDREAARGIAEALLDSLREAFELDRIRYVAQASAGIAMFPEHGTSVDSLLKNADIALYRAKASGRGRLCFFDESMSRVAADRLHLEERLRNAIRNAELVVHYQPKVNAAGAMTGVEALARWLPPGQEPIPPTRFVPLAEETGLIVPMGEVLLREVCLSLQAWRRRGLSPGPVAVNISMVQLRDPAFAATLMQCLAEHGLTGSDIQIELTESVFAEDRAVIATQLEQLAAAGIHIAIDDFGTGFSSMSLLRHFPIHSLKIDRSFVVDSTSSPESRSLLSGLIEIGHAMKLEVVAEGVETQAQFDLLRHLHCDVFQGYLFSAALTAPELESFLIARQEIIPVHRSAPAS